MGYAHTQYFPLAGLRWVSGLNIFDKGRQGEEYQTLHPTASSFFNDTAESLYYLTYVRFPLSLYG